MEQAGREQRRVNKMQVFALAREQMPHLVMIPDNEIGKVPAAVCGGRASTIWMAGNTVDVHPEQEGLYAEFGGHEVESC